MKVLILASTFCLLVQAQEKPAQEKTPAEFFQVNPQKLVGTGWWAKGPQTNVFATPNAMKMVGTHTLAKFRADTGLCSVPLLEAHANKSMDKQMAVTPKDSSVQIPQARVPAPSCEKASASR
jgi:hypothetical protein